MKNHAAAGNAFLYILIAIVLFAGLTFVMSRGHDSGDKTVLNQAELQSTVQRLLSYVNQTSQGWLQQSNTGTDLDELDLTLPSDVTFNNAPTIHKLFHPDGGGVVYRDMNEALFRASAAAPVGWNFVLVNADWSATAGDDLIMTYMNIKESLCAKINDMVRDDATIPTVTVNFTNTFVNASAPLMEAACPECKIYSSLCVQNTGIYAFYNILELR